MGTWVIPGKRAGKLFEKIGSNVIGGGKLPGKRLFILYCIITGMDGKFAPFKRFE
jgi:hypothetical protein